MDDVARLPARDRAALFGEAGAGRGVTDTMLMRQIMARAAASGRALYLDAAGTLVHTLGSRYDPSLNGGQGCLLRPALPVDEG